MISILIEVDDIFLQSKDIEGEVGQVRMEPQSTYCPRHALLQMEPVWMPYLQSLQRRRRWHTSLRS